MKAFPFTEVNPFLCEQGLRLAVAGTTIAVRMIA